MSEVQAQMMQQQQQHTKQAESNCEYCSSDETVQRNHFQMGCVQCETRMVLTERRTRLQ